MSHTEIRQKSAIELFDHAVIRCACWPVETLEPFRSPSLAAAAHDAARLRAAIEARRAALSDALYVAIPQIHQRETRQALLDARRRIHISTAPWRERLALGDATRILTSSLAAAIAQDELERTMLSDLERKFAERYVDELERERTALREVTGTPEFQRALAVASPELAIRWASASCATPEESIRKRGASSRAARMEASVFFYLCRAAARPTPGGLWAGVARLRVRHSADAPAASAMTVIPAKRKVLVSVNLVPFVRAIEGLRQQPRYRGRVRLSLSAYRDCEVWRFQTTRDPKHVWRSMAPDAFAAVLLENLADGRTRNLGEVLACCLSATDGHPGTEQSISARLAEAAEHLLECGLLTSGVVFPPAAADCWAALSEAAAQLTQIDREEWVRRVARIRAICDALSGEIDARPPDAVHDARRALDAELVALYRWTGIDETLPEPALLVDVRVPFDVLATAALWTSIRDATVDVLSFYQTHGAAENLRRATVEALLGDGLGRERPLLDTVRMNGHALDLSSLDAGSAAARLVERLQREVAARQRHCYERLVPPARDLPFIVAPADFTSEPLAGFDGTLVFSVAISGGLRAEWGRPHALCLVSRFASLLDAADEDGETLPDEIEQWYATWSAYGFTPVEVTGTDVLNPNAGTRPDVGTRQVGAVEGETLARLVVGASTAEARPWLRSGSDRRRLLPVYNCTGRIGAYDACSDALYRLALGHGWEFTCRRLFPRDEARIHIPRLILPGGVAVSPARWFLGQDQIEALLRLDRVPQYAAWLGQVRRLGLPERVRVATESGAEEPLLYLPVTSPLAVAALLGKIASRPRSLEFVEDHAGPDQWSIVDERGAHYASEVVVSWHDPSYLQHALDETVGDERL